MDTWHVVTGVHRWNMGACRHRLRNTTLWSPFHCITLFHSPLNCNINYNYQSRAIFSSARKQEILKLRPYNMHVSLRYAIGTWPNQSAFQRTDQKQQHNKKPNVWSLFVTWHVICYTTDRWRNLNSVGTECHEHRQQLSSNSSYEMNSKVPR